MRPCWRATWKEEHEIQDREPIHMRTVCSQSRTCREQSSRQVSGYIQVESGDFDRLLTCPASKIQAMRRRRRRRRSRSGSTRSCATGSSGSWATRSPRSRSPTASAPRPASSSPASSAGQPTWRGEAGYFEQASKTEIVKHAVEIRNKIYFQFLCKQLKRRWICARSRSRFAWKVCPCVLGCQRV